MSNLPTTRFPQPVPARASWMDELETVPFTDDFLETPAESQRVPSSVPPSSGIRVRGSDDSRPPDSGLGTLRPFVGHNPEIRPSNPSVPATPALVAPVLAGPALVAPALATPALVASSAPVGLAPVVDTARLKWMKGFAWGAALASLVLAAVAYQWRAELPAKVQATAAPVELDGDRIAPAAPDDLASRAQSGEKAALTALGKQVSQGLSAREVLALLEGDEAQRRVGAEEFVRKLSSGPLEQVKSAQLAELMGLVDDPVTFRATALVLAEAKTELGADLLYEVMRHVRLQPAKSALLHQLLLSSDVRAGASPAMSVILDAETSHACAEVPPLLERTSQVGDRRAIRHMAKFAERTGCGELGQKDCYPCLRQDRRLVDALRAAQDRAAPF